ncbi:MAG TPA: nuclear transport factor 2 family protein [Pseudomonas sp.]|nr:nuclear transport factor 2 family protein [Pseudomonas sp.]
MTTQRTKTEIATEFLTLCAGGRVREAYDRFVSGDFRHHNPWFAQDRQSLLEAMEQSAASQPNKSFEVKQAIESEDRVATLSHLKREQAPSEIAVVHILRFEGERIVEMWDIGQEIPPDSPNALGMF